MCESKLSALVKPTRLPQQRNAPGTFPVGRKKWSAPSCCRSGSWPAGSAQSGGQAACRSGTVHLGSTRWDAHADRRRSTLPWGKAPSGGSCRHTLGTLPSDSAPWDARGRRTPAARRRGQQDPPHGCLARRGGGAARVARSHSSTQVEVPFASGANPRLPQSESMFPACLQRGNRQRETRPSAC